jgi:hypothetical protein
MSNATTNNVAEAMEARAEAIERRDAAKEAYEAAMQELREANKAVKDRHADLMAAWAAAKQAE